MSEVRSLLRQSPVYLYLLVMLIWSYPFMVTVLTLMPLDPVAGPTAVQILLIALGTSPSLIGLLFAYRAGRGRAVGGLLAGLGRWKVGLRWLLVGVLTVPALNLASRIVFVLTGGSPYPLPTTPLLFALPAGVMTGLLEEIGWRGYALPELLKRHRPLAASLVLGTTWGLWHLPLFYLQRGHYGAIAVPILILESFLSLIALSALMTWIHGRAFQSLLVMVLFHFSQTSSNFLFQPPGGSSASTFLHFHLVSAALQWSLVAIVAGIGGFRQWVNGRPIPARHGEA